VPKTLQLTLVVQVAIPDADPITVGEAVSDVILSIFNNGPKVQQITQVHAEIHNN